MNPPVGSDIAHAVAAARGYLGSSTPALLVVSGEAGFVVFPPRPQNLAEARRLLVAQLAATFRTPDEIVRAAELLPGLTAGFEAWIAGNDMAMYVGEEIDTLGLKPLAAVTGTPPTAGLAAGWLAEKASGRD